MTNNSLKDRLAVCSWSLQPATPQALIAKLQATGIQRVQLALDPLRRAPSAWGKTKALLDRSKIKLASGMFGCVGEDYSTPQTICATGGIAPDHTWAQNWKDIQGTAELAAELELKLVTFHAGFLPHNEQGQNFASMRQRLAQVAEVFASRGIMLGLETGQEDASLLLRWLQLLNLPNLGINFDPANMILYAQGDPVKALRTLGSWVRQVHIKDATTTQVPGTWGQEVPVGAGQVDWPAFFRVLGELDYRGDFVIEREAGDQRVEDIRLATELVEREFARTSGPHRAAQTPLGSNPVSHSR
ncbi:Xylose isomerase domain protein TIM barrel [Verrucomicrobia bacterium]|nr:Xylose isomerase domain protein TIM barrel [Verrucomicrobiota bacterium]